MIKIKGREYPVSFFRIALADPVVKNAQYIRDTLNLTNNIQVFTAAINTLANILRQGIPSEEKTLPVLTKDKGSSSQP